MSARGVLSVVGTAVGSLIGWTDPPPAADPASVRGLLEEIGLPAGCDDHQVTAAVRAFQTHTDLDPDGIAGPQTVHLLVRYAEDARELRRVNLAA